MTPCEQLNPEDRAKRLMAWLFFTHGVVRPKDDFMRLEARPGYCTLCRVQLPVTWRAVKFLPETNGFRWVESDHSAEKLADVEKFRALPTDKYGLRDGYLLAPVKLCEAMMDDATWQRARVLLSEQWDERRRNAEIKERAESMRAKHAAAAMFKGTEF